MNRPIVLILLFLISACTPSSPKTDRDQRSYAVGFRLGQQLSPVKSELDLEFVARGLRDGVNGEPRLEASQLALRLEELQRKQAEMEITDAAARLKISRDFMQSISSKPTMRLLESGIVVEELKAGAAKAVSRSLKSEDELNVRYKAKTTDGKVFDEKSEVGGFRLRYRDLSVPGLRKAISKMPVGAEWVIYLAPEQAYGGSSRPGLPSQSVVVYEISLLAISPKK
ncbi:FKBP-type peptidyl-prolyl cis-trans isomerase [soil metagenome]